LIVQHPFLHAGTVKKEFSPVENPRAYREEFLKSDFPQAFSRVELVNTTTNPRNPWLDHTLGQETSCLVCVSAAIGEKTFHSRPKLLSASM
jgi:hypothetical protein